MTDSDADSLYLRGYDELTHHNLILRSGPTAAAGPLGFRVRSPADLDKAEAHYAALGGRHERLPAGAVRGLGEIVRDFARMPKTMRHFAAAKGEYLRIQVMELLLVKGWANRDVAAFLKIGEQQVANYRFAAVRKLTEAIREAGLPEDVFPELKPAQGAGG